MVRKLYIFPASPVARASMITAKIIGLELEYHELDFLKQEHLSPAYLKLNPQHTVPTLDDNGKVICDSHAINAYLVGKYAKDDSLYPKDLYKRALVDEKVNFDLGVLFPVLRSIDMAYFKKETKTTPPKLEEDTIKAYEFMEKFLEKNEWVALDTFTLADISCYTNITCLDYHVKVNQKTFPKLSAWIKRIQVLPFTAADKEGLDSFANFLIASNLKQRLQINATNCNLIVSRVLNIV